MLMYLRFIATEYHLSLRMYLNYFVVFRERIWVPTSGERRSSWRSWKTHFIRLKPSRWSTSSLRRRWVPTQSSLGYKWCSLFIELTKPLPLHRFIYYWTILIQFISIVIFLIWSSALWPLSWAALIIWSYRGCYGGYIDGSTWHSIRIVRQKRVWYFVDYQRVLFKFNWIKENIF